MHPRLCEFILEQGCCDSCPSGKCFCDGSKYSITIICFICLIFVKFQTHVVSSFSPDLVVFENILLAIAACGNRSAPRLQSCTAHTNKGKSLF